MKINVLSFGQVADITGETSLMISSVKNTAELNHLLQEQYPGLRGVKYLMAVNKKMIQTETSLNDGDTVALLPPFSGG